MFILQVDFAYSGPWGEAMTEAMAGLAQDIATEPGLVWKIWTANEAAKEAGGVYYFDNQADAKRYLAKHTARLQGFGIEQFNAKIFNVNLDLSRIDRAPV